MKKFVMLSAMVVTLGMVGIVSAGTLYVSLNDSMWAVGWYDLDGNYVNMKIFPSFVQDIEFDKSTGDLFALTTTGVFRLDQGGALTQITAAGAPEGQGGDIAISSSGDLAISLDDATASVTICDLDGVFTGVATFDSAVADIEYDQATGDLYALTTTGVWKKASGPPTQITYVGAALSSGGDIAISSTGDLAVSLNDEMPSVGIYNLSGVFTGMATFDSAVADIDYDMDTGDLYALTTTGIWKKASGVPKIQITYVGSEMNSGGDLAWAPEWECAEAVDCNDDNACTVEACVDNLCGYTDVVCNDDNDCTDDTCDVVSGCVYACNAADYTDECCMDGACSEELVCQAPGPCAGPAAEASVLK